MTNSHDNQPRQRGAALGIRALVLLYVLYLAYQIVAAYLRGDSDALSLPLTIGAAAILVILSVILLVLTYRQWKSSSAPSSPQEPSDPTDDASL